MGYFIARRVRRQAGSNCRHLLVPSALCMRIKKTRNDFSLRGLYKSGGERLGERLGTATKLNWAKTIENKRCQTGRNGVRFVVVPKRPPNFE